MIVTASTTPGSMGRAAVLGHPIGHSQSPLLHAAAYGHLGLDIDYTRIDLQEEGVEEFLAAYAHEQGWLGWSVTMPLKAAMVSHMAVTSSRVKTLGVLNTVIRQADGSLHGENTDVDGIVEALREAGLGSVSAGQSSERPLGILGAGATASAALAAAAELGSTEVCVYARSPERAASLAPVAQVLGLQLTLRPSAEFVVEAPSLSAAISTLPPRAADGLAEEFAADGNLAGIPLLDVAYDPWPSQLALGWERAGGTVVSGLVMLLHQAVRQVELFTDGAQAPAAAQSAEDHSAMVHQMRSALGL